MLLSDEAAAAACDAEVAGFRKQFPDVIHIEPGQLKQMLAAGPVTLVDVRSKEERAVSTISGSRALSDLPTNLSDLPDQAPLVLYCTVGFRSALEARRLAAHAPRAGIYSMVGVLKWAHSGGAFVNGSGTATNRVHTFGSKWQVMAPAHIDTVIFPMVSVGLVRALLRVPFVMLLSAMDWLIMRLLSLRN